VARNPPWTYDEILLALDLYLPERKVLEETDDRVVALSRLLNDLPVHADRAGSSFRSPDAVVLKLANLRSHDQSTPGAGMDAGGRRTAEIWQRYASRPEEVARLAAAIRSLRDQPSPASADGEDGVLEGRLLFRRHRERERDPGLASRHRAAFIDRHGRLFCEACLFDAVAFYGERGVSALESHHTRPLSEGGEKRTYVRDLALLCAACHRVVHASQPWLSLDELKQLVRQRGSPRSA
jgi:5-methylcytosine-specific restriction protein A